jgi:hypothetical protein
MKIPIALAFLHHIEWKIEIGENPATSPANLFIKPSQMPQADTTNLRLLSLPRSGWTK